MTELKRFKMVTTRRDSLWCGKEVGAIGVAKLILAAETEDEVRWFFSKIDWTAWMLVAVHDTPAEADKRGPGRPRNQPVTV